MRTPALERLPGPARKNDALFLYGALRTHPFVHVYEQTATEVVHGPSCRIDNEIDVARCREDRVAVVARRGGGGTVVLSPGMAIVVVVGERPGDGIRDIYRHVQSAMIACLEGEVPARIVEEGTSDLAIDGRKVAGSSLYLPRRSRLYCYQASIMVSSDLSLISRYLKHPPREPDYRAGRSHAEFCTTLSDEGCSLSVREVCARLRQGIVKREKP